MATINLNISQNDTININVVSSESNDNKQRVSKDELFERLYKDLVHKSNNMEKHLWYEVFYDFKEDFDTIYPHIKDIPYDIAFWTCWGYLVQQDEYYGSEQYLKDLDSMLSKCMFGT